MIGSLLVIKAYKNIPIPISAEEIVIAPLFYDNLNSLINFPLKSKIAILADFSFSGKV